MAVDEPARSKPNAFFTRYEIVAVAIPGGWGLHRALALTFLVIAALQPADRYGARALLTLGTLVMIGMTNRYRRQFYDQGTFEYLDLEECSTARPAK